MSTRAARFELPTYSVHEIDLSEFVEKGRAVQRTVDFCYPELRSYPSPLFCDSTAEDSGISKLDQVIEEFMFERALTLHENGECDPIRCEFCEVESWD